MTDGKFIGVICGLKSEARAVARSVDKSRIRIGVSGANAARAEAFAEKYCHAGASAIISVGMSGGLDPALKSGDLIIGDTVVGDDGGRYESDRFLIGAINKLAERRQAAVGAIFGSDEIIESDNKKAVLHQNHGCMAVDMESHGAARAAERSGVPFLAIRAIADPSHRALPQAALDAVAPDGSTRILSTLVALVKKPKQTPALMELGRDSDAALKTLRRDLGPLFAGLFLCLDL